MDNEVSRSARAYQSATNTSKAGAKYENNDMALSFSRCVLCSAGNVGANCCLEISAKPISGQVPYLDSTSPVSAFTGTYRQQ